MIFFKRIEKEVVSDYNKSYIHRGVSSKDLIWFLKEKDVLNRIILLIW